MIQHHVSISEELSSQAGQLQQTISIFRLGDRGGSASGRRLGRQS